jgi:ATP-dependent DNA ligase
MALPLEPPLEPQLAKAMRELPEGSQWSYEPKYDGFRALAFVDGEELMLQSRGAKPLHRYFPEVRFPPGRYVLDGELVIDGDPDTDEPQDFNALQQRLHPAASRIERLSKETPARYVAFDLLALDDESLLDEPLSARRARLESLAGTLGEAGIELTPTATEPADAEPWLAHGEGVVVKDLDSTYQPGKRLNWFKVKRLRTLDAVVAGYRHGKEPGTVGSLMLGLYDPDGKLHVVGHSSGLKPAEKRSLIKRLAPYETGERGSADPSRWATDRELEWVALRPELVVEVSFDQVSGGRIRHGTKIVRWREDKPPAECLLEQLDG